MIYSKLKIKIINYFILISLNLTAVLHIYNSLTTYSAYYLPLFQLLI